jgi:hypothetical protein
MASCPVTAAEINDERLLAQELDVARNMVGKLPILRQFQFEPSDPLFLLPYRRDPPPKVRHSLNAATVTTLNFHVNAIRVMDVKNVRFVATRQVSATGPKASKFRRMLPSLARADHQCEDLAHCPAGGASGAAGATARRVNDASASHA